MSPGCADGGRPALGAPWGPGLRSNRHMSASRSDHSRQSRWTSADTPAIVSENMMFSHSREKRGELWGETGAHAQYHCLEPVIVLLLAVLRCELKRVCALGHQVTKGTQARHGGQPQRGY